MFGKLPVTVISQWDLESWLNLLFNNLRYLRGKSQWVSIMLLKGTRGGIKISQREIYCCNRNKILSTTVSEQHVHWSWYTGQRTAVYHKFSLTYVPKLHRIEIKTSSLGGVDGTPKVINFSRLRLCNLLLLLVCLQDPGTITLHSEKAHCKVFLLASFLQWNRNWTIALEWWFCFPQHSRRKSPRARKSILPWEDAGFPCC